MSKILIVEDDLVLSRLLRNWLQRKNMQVDCVSSVSQARRLIAETNVDIILSDMRLPDGDGIQLLEWMNESRCKIPFIIMTQHADVLSAVRAMKLGAEDYLPKPFLPENLYTMLEGLMRKNQAHQKYDKVIFHRESSKMCEVERRAALVASTDMSVLICGENGTGKEYIAQLIHRSSQRCSNPFIAVDCGTIPRELAASEFFGHVKGSFTGAMENKTGVFYEAESGTLFLDEVGNLPYEVQALLLRALQERRYRPLGSRREITCDVRIVAATNENIEKAIEERRFREDLYHRLNEFTIDIPPLRECVEDILPLCEFFRERYSHELRREITGFTEEAKQHLLVYGWPGNVRELQNKIKRAVLITGQPLLDTECLDIDLTDKITDFNPVALRLKDEQKEKIAIVKALEASGGHRKRTAELLNIDPATLYRKMKKYGLK